MVAKLGGIAMEVNGYAWHDKPKPPTSEELMEATRHYYEYTIEQLHAAALHVRVELPRRQAQRQLRHGWNSFKRLTHGYSASDRAALFHDTAARVYRL